MKGPAMPEYAELEATLKARLADLTARAGEVEQDLRQPLDADLEDQAVDLADDEALEGVEDVLLQEIAQVRAALDRIANGTYGTCAVCGEEISLGRLQARPIATRCIAHAA